MEEEKILAGKVRGAYLLVLRLEKPQTLKVGSLGELSFKPGYYVYVGSAMGAGGVEGRVRRHLKFTSRTNGKPKWHVDYLLRGSFKPIEVFIISSEERIECKVSLLVEISAKYTFPGFGSSDCLGGCRGHLHYFNSNPLTILSRILGEAGLKWEKQVLT